MPENVLPNQHKELSDALGRSEKELSDLIERSEKEGHQNYLKLEKMRADFEAKSKSWNSEFNQQMAYTKAMDKYIEYGMYVLICGAGLLTAIKLIPYFMP